MVSNKINGVKMVSNSYLEIRTPLNTAFLNTKMEYPEILIMCIRSPRITSREHQNLPGKMEV